MKRVAILGSTGSIGTQTLDVIRRHPGRFRAVALAGGRNVDRLAEQVAEFGPEMVACGDTAGATALASRGMPGVHHGAEGLLAVATESGADVVVAATDGAVAFDAVFAAVRLGVRIAVANKELIVAAGELLAAEAARSGAELIPVDSEHSALFQCLVGEPKAGVATLVLTASGGPFWELDAAAMRDARPADALRHPTWQMGAKNTIDSASLMNKGLEVIEASRLFGMPVDRIEVLVHRTSVAHGFVVFTDGNVKAQLAPPDMRLPIGYALAFPDRLPDIERMEPLMALGSGADATRAVLAFERPDLERFPCLALAYEAGRRGGTVPAALSAANEIAVAAFLKEQIRFGEIAAVVADALAGIPDERCTLETVRAADRRARAAAARAVEARFAGAAK